MITLFNHLSFFIMNITYNWRIAGLDPQNSDGLVTTAHWVAIALIEGEEKARISGTVGLEKSKTLIPYSDLTEPLVIGWVKSRLGSEYVTAVESSLFNQIQEESSPKVSNGLPW